MKTTRVIKKEPCARAKLVSGIVTSRGTQAWTCLHARKQGRETAGEQGTCKEWWEQELGSIRFDGVARGQRRMQ